MNPLRVRVKICGITSVKDAMAAADVGVDAVGLVFYPRSKRYVTIEQACAIRDCLPPFVTLVGLFLDADREEVHSILTQVAVDVLQFHGLENERQCTGYGRPYIKALSYRRTGEFDRMAADFPHAQGFLIDGHEEGGAGGTGREWITGNEWNAGDINQPWILAGGLTASNVQGAILRARPWGVDVSSGVENAPGIKDGVKMLEFMRAVRIAESMIYKE